MAESVPGVGPPRGRTEDGYDGICRIQGNISEIEDEGDHVVHEIFERLRETFITPFDPEDIQALATSLDDVLDGIDDVTFRIVAYRLKPIPPRAAAGRESQQLLRSAVAALAALHQKRPVIGHCIEINRLENEADKLERNLLAELFLNEKDAISLIKQKESTNCWKRPPTGARTWPT